MLNSSIYAVFERMWQNILIKLNNYATQAALDGKADSEHEHSATNITTGILDIEHGGTGYDSIVDTTYTVARYRASALDSTETIPVDNGIINWMYE